MSFVPSANATQAYFNRFLNYMAWDQQLPTIPSATFLQFVDGTTPLAQKLREKWLYELARQENWSMYIQHYQPSTDASLQCYAQFAAYQQGDRQRAIVNSKLKWLTGDSLPPACDKLFILLFKENVFNNALIITRVKLALESRNYTLANYLLKKINHPLHHDDQILESIQQHPQRITRLAPNELSSDFYLYGLKRLLTRNATQAIKLWQQAVRQARLTERQQQSFLTQVALYKAMHNQYDAPAWFAKIKQPFNTEAVIDWHIRFALRHRDWATVESLIKHATNHDSPCWQYWLARAMEAQGRHEQATIIYNNLAPNRHYYGFLASIRQHKPLQFDHETVTPGDQALQLYQPITDQIKALYFSKQTARASRLVNDFASELPKDEKSAFAYWIANNLHWFGKSVYLSTHNDLANQLNLRFPLAYHDLIKQQATHYHLSEALIFAMIRQESAFREDVISFAGARGLMQVMPATARWLSTLRHIPFHDKAQLLSIPYNIMLGTAYLNQLGNRFNNHPLLMAAAYNAGPRQVQAWLNSHPLQQADIWIETIPFYETRNYLKNVIAFYAVYQHRLQQKPNLDAFLRPFI